VKKKRVILWVPEEYTKFKFLRFSSKYLEKRFPITLSEKGLGLLGIGSMFKNKFAIGESRMGLKKSAAKKISGEKNRQRKKSAAKKI
jgi:hypothetical protein